MLYRWSLYEKDNNGVYTLLAIASSRTLLIRFIEAEYPDVEEHDFDIFLNDCATVPPRTFIKI